MQGYTGSNCGEFEGYTCANLRCQNDGYCQTSPSGRPQCVCSRGFSGLQCEHPPCPCQNEGVCVKSLHKPYSFFCTCRPGYSGELCQIRDRTTTCPYVKCLEKSGDRVCDSECKNVECDWDGGDCTLHRLRPWENCTLDQCWQYFHNGRCDPECDNAGCLFDSFECQRTTSIPSMCKYVPEPHAQFENQFNSKCVNILQFKQFLKRYYEK